jgi:hypothetical protein
MPTMFRKTWTMRPTRNRTLCLKLAVLIITLPISNHAHQVTSNILQRVFLINYGEKFGTSFTIEVQKRQYLISARHVLEGIKNNNTVMVFHENTWKSITVRSLYIEPKEIDIIVLALPEQLSPTSPIESSFDQIYCRNRYTFSVFHMACIRRDVT